MINNKKFNLLDLEFISVKSIENYAYKDLFEKYKRENLSINVKYPY